MTANKHWYRWHGITATNKRVKGYHYANSQDCIHNELHIKQIKLISCHRLWLSPRITIRMIHHFLEQLIELLSAQITLNQSLLFLSQQQPNPYLQFIINHIQQSIADGLPLHLALANFPKDFNSQFIYAIRSGEQTGQLTKVLSHLKSELLQTIKFGDKLKSALAYPSITLVSALLIAAGLVIFLIPNLSHLFAATNTPLPALTRNLLALTNAKLAIYNYLSFSILIFATIRRLIRRLPRINLLIARIKLKLPITGKLILAIEITRWTRLTTTLLLAGLPLAAALQQANPIVHNNALAQELAGIHQHIILGNSFNAALSHCVLLPNFVKQLIQLGDKSSRVKWSLERITAHYEQESERIALNLLQWLEPLALMMIASVISLAIAALYLPLFNIANTF